VKIVIVMTGLGVLPGRSENVSGHIQIPLKTAEMLLDEGHEVTLLSTSQLDGTVIPAFLPKNLKVISVSDGRRRSSLSSQEKKNGYRISSLIKQIKETAIVIKEINPDIVHVFGFERMARYSGLLKLLTKKTTFVTILGGKPLSIFKYIYNKSSAAFVLTESVKRDWSRINLNIHLTRPGIVRNMTCDNPSDERDTILFWREASKFGGADICLEAFLSLANKYPDLKFTFAVRKNEYEIENLDEFSQKFDNLIVHRFPYKNDITLQGLIDRSIVTVLPFRELSIEPQMTVMETLAMGCPVICTDYRSLSELVINNENGYVVDSDKVDQLVSAIESAVQNKSELNYRREKIKHDFNEKWNWNRYYDSVVDRYQNSKINGAV